jgi:hypothetical protein
VTHAPGATAAPVAMIVGSPRAAAPDRETYRAAVAGLVGPAVAVMAPGAWVLLWSVPRIGHWTATAAEDAGLAIRDRITHVYGVPGSRPGVEDWWFAKAPGPLRELGVDGCRVAPTGESLGGGRVSTKTEGWDRPWKHDADAVAACKGSWRGIRGEGRILGSLAPQPRTEPRARLPAGGDAAGEGQ